MRNQSGWPGQLAHRMLVELAAREVPEELAETDGERYHMLPSDRERDYRKDAWLQRHKIAVLRVGEFRFEHDREGVAEDLLGLLGLGDGA
jgi:very-short-patch-repair endonuclease